MLLTDEIRKRLEHTIIQQKLSNYKIAKELNISATTLSNYLTGKVKKADNTKIEAICRVLGISLHWLTTGQNKVSMSEYQVHPEAPESEDLKEVVKQIFLILQAREDQYLNIHQDVNRLRTELSEFKQEIHRLIKK